TFVLLTAAFLQISAKGVTQTVTLSLKDAPLFKVFKEIEKQTGFGFLFSKNTIKDVPPVSINVKDVPVLDALQYCFKGQPLRYSIENNTIVVSRKPVLQAQLYDIPLPPLLMPISGKVSDESGQPVIGASVQLKNSSVGTSTNSNGEFQIEIPDNSSKILSISYVGMETQEINVNGKTSVNVVLKRFLSQQEEVVVIGYGTRKRRDVTGALSVVGSKEIEKSTALTPELALQGRAAGVFVNSGGGDPQSRPTIRIRGVNTFGNAEPLYVVDGVPIFEGGSGITDGGIGDIRSPINIFSMINPQDIESITVLKDASAAAIYGVRASNGVILITTKKGASGRAKVEATAQYGVQNIPKSISTLNTQQYFDLVREAYAANPEPGKTFEQKFGPLYDQSNSQYVGNGKTYDWQDALKNKNAPIQDYSVRLSGGNEGTQYYLSAGYAKQESPLKSNNLERFTIATNVDSRISKYVSAGLTVRLVNENAFVNTGSDLGTMMATIPFQPIFDPNDPTGYAAVTSGTFKPNPDYDPTKLDPGAPFIFATGPDLLWGQQTRFNVFAFQKLGDNSYNLTRALGNAYVQAEPFTGLKIKASFGGDYFINLRKQWTDNDQWRFSQTPGNPYAGGNAQALGTYGERQGKTYNINKEITLNYNHTFFNDHNIDFIAAVSDQYTNWYVNDLSGKVDYTDPQYRGIRNQPPYTSGFASILEELRLIGYVGRLSYKYKDKYYLDGTLRYDGASKLAPGYKWDYFPSFAAGWRISSEKFFPKTTFINDLKFRGGWGTLGNINSAGAYKFLSNVNFSSDYSIGSGNGNGVGTQVQGATLPDFANTTLTWEKLHTTNFGFDAVLFDNRINFTAEWYNKLTYGIIQSVSLPPNTGIQSPADLNIGEVRNKGFEFQLGYNGAVGPVLFSVSGNLTTVDNKVVKLYNSNPLGAEGGRIEEGYSMFYLWGYKAGGIFQTQAEIDAWRAAHADVGIGQVLGDPSKGYVYQPGDMYFRDVYGNPTLPKERYSQNPDSIINSNDRAYLGKTIPGFYYGININANWKGFDVSALFQGVGDVKKYNYLRSGAESMGGLANQWSTVLDRWTTQNPSKSIPRAVFNNPSDPSRFSSRYVESAAYLRLRNLQIGYTIPKGILNSTGFVQRLRMYASAINLFTVTKWSGLDPENDGIPPTRQFLLGMSATF
ncbi:MAG: TonB-dependent receptor, partial [Ginsengibacter sp.]